MAYDIAANAEKLAASPRRITDVSIWHTEIQAEHYWDWCHTMQRSETRMVFAGFVFFQIEPQGEGEQPPPVWIAWQAEGCSRDGYLSEPDAMRPFDPNGGEFSPVDWTADGHLDERLNILADALCADTDWHAPVIEAIRNHIAGTLDTVKSQWAGLSA